MTASSQKLLNLIKFKLHFNLDHNLCFAKGVMVLNACNMTTLLAAPLHQPETENKNNFCSASPAAHCCSNEAGQAVTILPAVLYCCTVV